MVGIIWLHVSPLLVVSVAFSALCPMPTNPGFLLANFHCQYSHEEEDQKTGEEYKGSMLKGKV
jgi:hypothetical protein